MQPWWWTPAGWQKPQDLGALLLLLLLQLLSPQLAGCSLADEPPGGAFSNASNSSDSPGIPNPTDGPPLPLQSQTTSSTKFQVLPPICGFSYERDPTLRDPEAMNRRWPWMVSVRANGVHVCAGILIASQWVLAVAHCLTEHANYTVMVGSPWIDQSPSSSSSILVLHVIMNRRFRAHRYWSWIGRANNIGLLRLQKKLMYNEYVRPICLPGVDFVLEDSSVCSVTGWGSPRVNGQWPQFQTIHEKEVVILNSKECDDFYHEFSRIPSLVRIINSQMICVKDGSREEFCYEASGEPLVCSLEGMWYLVGMTSWGAGCKESEAPPIFLKVSAYQTWIWDSLSGKSLALPAPSRALLLALPLPLSLLATL